MRTREKIIAEKALDAFRRNTELNAELLATHVVPDQFGDGILRITHKEIEWWFAVEIKLRITRAIVGMLQQQLLNYGEKGLLIAEYVNPNIAELLKDLEIPFIDTAGNTYIKEHPLYIYIKGNKPTNGVKIAPPKRLFKPAGLKVVFALLNNPGIENEAYRDIAKAAQVALGTVSWVVYDLKDLGFFLKLGKKGRKICDKNKLLKRWVETYPEQLRPKLIRERFEVKNRNWWKEVDITEFGAFWGGEIAAAKITGYLKPEKYIIYTDEPIGKLVLKHKLRKAEPGNLEILNPFWDFNYNMADKGIVPPLLVYADLMADGDQRNIEAAGIIYEKHLDRFIREN